MSGKEFAESLDYVGLDFFPDVFRRVSTDGEPGDLTSSIRFVLETLRKEWMANAGIPSTTPIAITECGWPTSAGRSWDQQARVLERTVRTVSELRARLNIDRFTLFSLRDVALQNESNQDDLFQFFGITTADYKRKPAFYTLKQLIAEFGATC